MLHPHLTKNAFHTGIRTFDVNNIGLEFKPTPHVKMWSMLISKGARGSWCKIYFQELLCSIFIVPMFWVVADSFPFLLCNDNTRTPIGWSIYLQFDKQTYKHLRGLKRVLVPYNI